MRGNIEGTFHPYNLLTGHFGHLWNKWGGPAFGKTEETSFRHFHKSEGLLAGDEESIVSWALDLKVAPKSRRGGFSQSAMDLQLIAENRWALVIDLGPDDYGIDRGLGHAVPIHAKPNGQECPCSLDKSQIGNVMNNTTGIGVEKHDLNRRDYC